MRFFISFFFLFFGILTLTVSAQEMCVPNGNGNFNGTSSGYEGLVGTGKCAGINCECASLVKAYNPSLGAASTWAAGQHVSANSCPPSGTPIATFNDFGSGKLTYGDAANPGGASGKSHSAVLKGCSSAGMTVVEQYNSSGGVIETVIPWDKTGLQGGDKYYAITSPTAQGTPGLSSESNVGTTPSGSKMCDPSNDASVAPPSGVLDENSTAGGVSSAVYNLLAKEEACWSCRVYESLAKGTVNLFSQTYSMFIENEKFKFVGIISGVFILVLMWKVMLIISFQAGVSPNQLAERWSDVLRYVGRIMVVVSLFLFAGVGSYITSSSDNNFNGARDFVDVPFAVGTSMACSVMDKANTAMSLPAGDAMTCGNKASGSFTNWISEHVEMAKKILFGFHQIGVKGISFGVYLMTGAVFLAFSTFTSSLSLTSQSGFIASIPMLMVMFMAGLVMVLSFITFTVSFGMRFIDALLRGFVAIALAPIFFFLWVFDKTREMAHSAIRSVLFMGAVFVLSAITYPVAMSIVNWSFTIVPAATSLASDIGLDKGATQTAGAALSCYNGDSSSFLSAGQRLLDCYSTAGSVNASSALGNLFWDVFGGKDLGTTSAEQVSQTSNQMAKVQWTAYFIVMAAFGLASGLVQVAFTVAESLVAFRGSRKVDTGNLAFNAAESAGEAISNRTQGAATFTYEAPGKMFSRRRR